jgi:alkylation response protein AidB-like acyl-CoA dehydrogenase
MREGIKESLRIQKRMRADIRSETQINRVVKADQRAAAKAARILARNQRAHERIAKLEARIEAMRLKANSPKQVRKSQRAAGPVKVWSTEEIAALNA